MSDLVMVVFNDIVTLLQLPPFNYIVGCFLISICLYFILSLVGIERR